MSDKAGPTFCEGHILVSWHPPKSRLNIEPVRPRTTISSPSGDANQAVEVAELDRVIGKVHDSVACERIQDAADLNLAHSQEVGNLHLPKGERHTIWRSQTNFQKALPQTQNKGREARLRRLCSQRCQQIAHSQDLHQARAPHAKNHVGGRLKMLDELLSVDETDLCVGERQDRRRMLSADKRAAIRDFTGKQKVRYLPRAGVRDDNARKPPGTAGESFVRVLVERQQLAAFDGDDLGVTG